MTLGFALVLVLTGHVIADFYLSGRGKEVKKGTYLITLLFVLMFIFM